MRVVRTKSERKKEIMEAAKSVFLEKGFEKATMEDIVARTTLSKGGVYYYYANTKEILHDLMVEGIFYRRDIIRDSGRYEKPWDMQTLVEILVDKVLDESDLMDLYVIYLQAARRHPELQQLMDTLREETASVMSESFAETNQALSVLCYSEEMTALVNTIILGANVLQARELFQAHRPILQTMFQQMLERLQEGS